MRRKNRRLELNRETVLQLQVAQEAQVQGGATTLSTLRETCLGTCKTNCSQCCP